MKAYVDVNVLYYFLTANGEFGERAKELLERYSGRLITSALTVWQLHILFRRQKAKVDIADILPNLGIEVVPLTFDILREAERCEKLDFDDAIHYTTMKVHGVRTILSSDRDFDRMDVKRIF
ncbi:type II toxin-antitoxin system VapC family toxin [Thermococcus thermotolerans]|uniref:type II toxin-antitoxin system VapC family toxin n=1 Tax=Thermococcus thermotolerans TaxID=2969672 RepID=UPI0021588A4B|nr:type II toxin-antitoxin system VapC family toxin [Thermococcus thermotolerans]